MILPVTPLLGEEITIPFLEDIDKFYRGYCSRDKTQHKRNNPRNKDIYSSLEQLLSAMGQNERRL
jgi:hypothetical protein